MTRDNNLYVTAGGRVVLRDEDNPYGENVSSLDSDVFTLDDLRKGISVDTFIKKIREVDEDDEDAKGDVNKPKPIETALNSGDPVVLRHDDFDDEAVVLRKDHFDYLEKCREGIEALTETMSGDDT